MKTEQYFSVDRLAEMFMTLLMYMVNGLIAIMLLTLVVLLMTQPAHASQLQAPIQADMAHPNDATRGSLLFRGSHADGVYSVAPLLETNVSMQVTGMLARVRVEQKFHNPSLEWQEGIYVFPLPDDSAVDGLRMQIGDRIIEGQIKQKAEARRIYKQAKTAGKKAALIEQQRANIFSNSVANIGPGETITIIIHYQQRVHYNNGVFALRFPMTITPRYVPHGFRATDKNITEFSGDGWGSARTTEPDDLLHAPVALPGNIELNPLKLDIVLQPGFALADLVSPYHSINSQRVGEQYRINLAEGSVPANRDFELRWRAVESHVPTAALFSESRDEADYALIMLIPPQARDSIQRHLPREIVFVIDTSGSMGGRSIRQARQALALAVSRLNSTDTFNIIQFNTVTSRLFSGSVPADTIHKSRATRYINALEAGGGTEMLPALQMALTSTHSADESEKRVRQVVFLTDGSVSNEAELFRLIKTHLADTRLFTIGIGSAPNSYFMRKAAEFGKGTFTHIGDVHEVNRKMTELFAKIERPVLTDIQLDWTEMEDVDVYPQRIPDLYSGEPVVLSVRAVELRGELKISGLRAGAPWQRTLTLSGGMTGNGIAKRWAREKIAALMDSLHDGHDRDKVKKAVVETALRHHLVSRFTSLVAVDVTPTRPADRKSGSAKLPNHLPAGADYARLVGGLPHTATMARFNIILGLLAFVMGLASLLYALSGLPFLRRRAQ